MKRLYAFLISLLLINSLAVPAMAFNFDDWDSLLKKHLSSGKKEGIVVNLVDYKAMKADPLYKKVVKDLKFFSPSTLSSKEEKLSFWINTYNIFAVKMVTDNYPVKSIRDIGSFFTSVWKKDVGKIGGKVYTLDEIEHEILRKMGEPKIHSAIVCASLSCPDLRKEAYLPEKLNTQLDDQFGLFLKNETKGVKIDKTGKVIHLSSIFKWFGDDFEKEGGVIEVIGLFLEPSQKRDIKEYKIKYIDYNWNLNET